MKITQNISIAIEKTDYLKEISDDFFEIATIEAGNSPIDLAPINLNSLLSEIILEQYKWITIQGLQTNFVIPDKALIIENNEHLLRRIINNLFSKVHKYAVSFVGVELKQEDNKISICMVNDTNGTDIIDNV